MHQSTGKLPPIIPHTSTLIIPTKIQGRNVDVSLKDTLYAPDIAFTLISLGRCDDAGFQTFFDHQKCIVKDKARKTLIEAPKFHGLYRLDHKPSNITACPSLPVDIHKKTCAYIVQGDQAFI
jgi:hypothetical protein